jgi:hypothetical protein
MEGGKCGSPTARVKVAKEKRGLVDRRQQREGVRAKWAGGYSSTSGVTVAQEKSQTARLGRTRTHALPSFLGLEANLHRPGTVGFSFLKCYLPAVRTPVCIPVQYIFAPHLLVFYY